MPSTAADLPAEPSFELFTPAGYARLLASPGGSDLEAIFANGRWSIMQIFAMLQVVEERGVRQFPMVAAALGRVDPESAEVVAAIIRDEQRHVGYARAISRRYAPDPASLEQVLGLCREVEARAFAENERAYLRFAVEHELLVST